MLFRARDRAVLSEGSFVSEAAEIWDHLKVHVKENIPSVEFHTWFSRVQAVGVQDGTFVLGVTSSFAADWLKQHYLPLLEEGLKNLGMSAPKVSFKVLPSTQDAVLEPEPRPKQTSAPLPDDGRSRLNVKYSFEKFVIGQNNSFAHAAALAVAESPGKAYNPLFIYGGVGLGKTHLMHAVGHSVAERFPEKRIEYISTETFTNDLINAIREDRMASFKDRYRSVDLLLVDDIQFIAGKERTQEEFFHTFNALYEMGKQILLSSDRPPRDILTLEARLRSRFEWGLITDIQSPELETRIAILRMNSEYRHVSIPDEVLEFIAKQVTSNIRELEGALMRVIAYSSLNGIEGDKINRAVAAKALSNVFTDTEANTYEMQDILDVTAAHYSIQSEALKTTGRAKEVVIPRQVAMYLMRELTSHSLPEIGTFFGRDHTTILYAIQKIAETLERDKELDKVVREIRTRLA
jgi:chromosomal replication initiator protein